MRDYKEIESLAVRFIQDYVAQSGAKNLLLGVSGGLDSAVVAALCAKAMPQNSHALILPTDSSSGSNIDDATSLCKRLNLKFKIINIQPILNAFISQIDSDANLLRLGNLAARTRMCLLYDYSAAINAIVVGTSNKSEIMLGYSTIYGDTAYALNPIGELYKSEIFEFARFLNIDEATIAKTPSADFWQGQSDEADLGFSYELIDKILKDIELKKDENELIKFYPKDAVRSVLKRIKINQFKRQMPPIANFNIFNQG